MKNNLMIADDEMSNIAYDIAYAYNLCVVLSKQIIDYDDKHYLRLVRKEILNNFNLENFPKEDALYQAIDRLLSTLSWIDNNYDEKEAIEQKYQRQKENALWTAVPSPSTILAGGSRTEKAVNALLDVGTSFMNYKRTMNSIEEEKIGGNLKLEQQKKVSLEGIQNRLFECAWQLAKDHPIPDELRLSENDVDDYNDILKDTDIRRRYERLEDIAERFGAYPPFWFNLGETAREIYIKDQDEDFRKKAVSAFEKFDRNHFVFLRQDIFAASCAISHISLLDDDKDSEKIKDLLQRAIEFSRGNDDLLQQCVPIAFKIGDIDTARKLLRQLINENQLLEFNGKLLSLIYNRYDYDEAKYNKLVGRIGPENSVPWLDIKPQYRLEQFMSSMEKY